MEELKEMFKDIPSGDPKIKITDEVIEIIPFYWNYNFITNFVPVLIIIFIFNSFKLEDGLETLICLLTIGVSIFNIFYQLRYYNKLIINYKNKTIQILPNIIMALFAKEKLIFLRDTKRINYSTDGFWLAYRRYVLSITLTNDSQQFRLVSTEKEENAKRITEALLKLM